MVAEQTCTERAKNAARVSQLEDDFHDRTTILEFSERRNKSLTHVST